jgi:hypothetical protein
LVIRARAHARTQSVCPIACPGIDRRERPDTTCGVAVGAIVGSVTIEDRFDTAPLTSALADAHTGGRHVLLHAEVS